MQAVIADAEARSPGSGRLVIRPSGTEPVIRVMAEGDDAGEVERGRAICAAVEGGGLMLEMRPDCERCGATCPPSARRVHLLVRMHLLRECAEALDDAAPIAAAN